MTPNGESKENAAHQTAKLADVSRNQNLPNGCTQSAGISDALGAECVKRPHHSDNRSERTDKRAKLKPSTDLCQSFTRVIWCGCDLGHGNVQLGVADHARRIRPAPPPAAKYRSEQDEEPETPVGVGFHDGFGLGCFQAG